MKGISMQSSLRKMKSAFRLKSIFFKILLVLAVLIIGVLSLFYFVISHNYKESREESTINTSLAALNLMGNQMEEQVLKLETQMEELLNINIMEKLSVDEDIYTNSGAISIVQRLKLLTDDNMLALKAFIYMKQSDAVLSSDQTVKHLEDTDLTSVVEYYQEQADGKNWIFYNEKLYIFCEIPRGHAITFGAVEIDDNYWYREFVKITDTLQINLKIYPFLEKEPLFQKQMEYPDSSAFMIRNREIRTYGDEVCDLSQGSEKLLSHNCNKLNIYLLGFLSLEGSGLPLSSILSESFPIGIPVILLMISAGVVLILIICKPMKKTVNDIMQQRNSAVQYQIPENIKNEFELISGLFQEQKRHESELNVLLQKSREAVMEQMLLDIIEGNEKNEAAVRAIFSKMEPSFDCDLVYKMILITVLREENVDFSAIEEEVRKMALCDFGKEFWKEKAQVNTLNHKDQNVILVLGFPAESSVRNINIWTNEFSELCLARFKGKSQIPVLGSSAILSGILSLEEAYGEAKLDLQKKLYYGTEGKETKDILTIYEGKVHACLEKIVSEPEEVVQDIKSLIRSAENYPKEESIIYLKCIDSIWEYLLRYQISYDDGWVERRSCFTDEGYFQKHKDALKQWLEDFAENALEKMIAQAGTVQMQYLEQAQNYIRSHYEDSNLSLLVVSESCGISRGYLSKIFAKYSSGGFTDYLNYYRVQQACELLKKTGFSVQEVGLKTGFNSPQSFSRVFKKYTTYTPSQYRMQKKGKE